MIVDFRKQQREHAPIHIDGTVVEKVECFKFLGLHIMEKLIWSTHTATVVKSGCITAWYSNCTALNRKSLQRVVRSHLMSQEGLKAHQGQQTQATACSPCYHPED
jgi:hypothetical protein